MDSKDLKQYAKKVADLVLKYRHVIILKHGPPSPPHDWLDPRINNTDR
jgi:hypothetical protein